MDDSKKSVTSNVIWRFAERIGAQLVSFVVTMVLARLLSPEDYGQVSIVFAITTILSVFVDSGLGNAIIQKEKVDDLDYSTVFWFNVLVCVSLYILMFALSNPIAKFYNQPELKNLIRIVSIILLISGVKNIQQAYVSKNLIFKKFFFSTIGGTIGAAIIGIIMAYKGFGAWALVAQYLFNNLVDTAILWITVKWRPRFCFSLERLKYLFGYGWKLLASSLLEAGYKEAKGLIIGKKYTSADLAYSNKGNQFPDLILTNVGVSISSVVLPVMSNAQSNLENLKNKLRKTVRTTTYVMTPMLLGLAATSHAFISLILSDKWLPCVPYMVIFCVSDIFHQPSNANLNAIKAVGRSDIFLKLEIIKKILAVIFIIITIQISPLAICVGYMALDLVGLFLNAWPNIKIFNYTLKEQLSDYIPIFVNSTVMAIIVYAIGNRLMFLPTIIVFFLQILSGFIIYVSISLLIKDDTFFYLKEIVMTYIKKN